MTEHYLTDKQAREAFRKLDPRDTTGQLDVLEANARFDALHQEVMAAGTPFETPTVAERLAAAVQEAPADCQKLTHDVVLLNLDQQPESDEVRRARGRDRDARRDELTAAGYEFVGREFDGDTVCGDRYRIEVEVIRDGEGR